MRRGQQRAVFNRIMGGSAGAVLTRTPGRLRVRARVGIGHYPLLGDHNPPRLMPASVDGMQSRNLPSVVETISADCDSVQPARSQHITIQPPTTRHPTPFSPFPPLTLQLTGASTPKGSLATPSPAVDPRPAPTRRRPPALRAPPLQAAPRRRRPCRTSPSPALRARRLLCGLRGRVSASVLWPLRSGGRGEDTSGFHLCAGTILLRRRRSAFCVWGWYNYLLLAVPVSRTVVGVSGGSSREVECSYTAAV